MHQKPRLDGRRIWTVPGEEIYGQGHLACPGCGVAIAARLAMKALGRKTILVVPACCFAVIDGPFPGSAAGVPLLHCAFETAAATASGVRAGLSARGDDDTLVVAWAGDGGTYDIGFQALSAAAERNEDILYVCYDNEAYMNTGVQRSGATPFSAWTTTTPAYPGKREQKKDLAAIMIAHHIPYFATASLSYVDDFIAKFRKARAMRGFRFIHIFSPCSPGWKIAESDTIAMGFLAVRSRLFPLMEVEEGGSVRRITVNPSPVPVLDYLQRQGRFKHLRDDGVKRVQEQVDRRWAELTSSCTMPQRPQEVSLPAVSRGPLPAREELEHMISEESASLTPRERELACGMLQSMWGDPVYAGHGEHQLAGLAVTLVQMTGAF